MVCQRCHAFSDDGKLGQQIQEYLLRMDPEICCEEDEYERRLGCCDSCPDLINAMCKHCGCFVVLRARKQKMYCPHPGGNQWDRER